MMYQNNYNGYQTFGKNQQQMQLPVGLKGRPVSSLDEARASQIDFDGSMFFFPDIANKRIYTKQINMDGTASLNVYEYVDVPTGAPQYVLKDEFDSTLVEIKSLLNEMRQPAQTAPKDEQPQLNF